MDHFDPERPDFKPYGLTCVNWTPSPMGRPDHHNEVELNLICSGWVTYLLGGSKLSLSAGNLGAFWASIPHQVIDYGADTEYFVVTIPFAWFLQFNLPEQFTQTLLKGSLIAQELKGNLPSECERFSQWEQDLANARVDYQDIVLLELQARLQRLALYAKQEKLINPSTVTSASPSTIADGSLNKVEQIACYIAQSYLEPLTSESIGQAVGLHPNYAMNLFKRTFGTTLVDYITHHRISHAQRLLITTDMKILDVAMASGFNTLSRFNKAFRRTFGGSPREYRASQLA